jgi:hypothetical protein
MYAHASAAFFDPFGIAHALPLNIVIGPPFTLVKYRAIRSTSGELF